MATKKKTATAEELEDVIEAEDTEKVDLTKVSAGPVRLDDNVLINVKSNVFGELRFVDKRTQEETKWQRCGEVMQMSFGALRTMKATEIAFFQNQWIIITGFADETAEKYSPADIYKALLVTQYYKHLIEPSDYQALCSWEPEEIKDKVALMSDQAKLNLAVALNVYIKKGILDSLKRIKAFEEVLGCELKIPE